jgi:hypothetical protein
MSRIDGKRPKESAKRKRDNRKRPTRLQFFLPPDENTAIDDFRYRTRMPSKAAAIRELLRRGLASADED